MKVPSLIVPFSGLTLILMFFYNTRFKKLYISFLTFVVILSILLLESKASCIVISKSISEIFVSNDSVNLFILYSDSTFISETSISDCGEGDLLRGKYTLNKDTITFVNDNISWSSASSINIGKAEIYRIKYIRINKTNLLLHEITQYTNNMWMILFSKSKNKIITELECKEGFIRLNKISIEKFKSNQYLNSRYGHFITESNEYGLKNTCWQSNQENILIKIDNYNNVYLIDSKSNRIIKEGVFEIDHKVNYETNEEDTRFIYLYVVYDKLDNEIFNSEKGNKIHLTIWQLSLFNQELELYEVNEIVTFLGSEVELNNYKENPQNGMYFQETKKSNIKFIKVN